jgi:hypothetical protein
VAFLTGRAPPLDSLSLEWPRGEEDARLAYLLSATAVRHLAERAGPDGFEVLMQAWQREGTLDRAIRSAYGMTMGQFEEEWARSVRRRYGWMLVGAQAGCSGCSLRGCSWCSSGCAAGATGPAWRR